MLTSKLIPSFLCGRPMYSWYSVLIVDRPAGYAGLSFLHGRSMLLNFYPVIRPGRSFFFVDGSN